MTLQSAIDGELPFLRAEAEARMTSRVRTLRKTGDTTTGPDGFDVPEWEVIYPDLPFRLGGRTNSSPTFTITVGGVERTAAARTGNFPALVDGVPLDLRDEDYIDVTAGENVGLVLRIVEADWMDQATARRVPVVSVERPEEWF